MVDCSEASNKDCHHAQHAANAFDTEKVALMHGIFQMLQTPPGKAPTYHYDYDYHRHCHRRRRRHRHIIISTNSC